MSTQTSDVESTVVVSIPRRPHTKSRSGCLDCRRRRVKCSEEKPECRACRRRGVECQYPPSTYRRSPVSQHADEASPASASTSTSTPGQPLIQCQCQCQCQCPCHHFSPIPNLSLLSRPAITTTPLYEQSPVIFSIEEMALFQHWTLHTSLDIYKNSSLSSICQVGFSQSALQHPFVMHAVLSLTAAHIAYLNPEKRLRYIANAAHYHNEGLKGFREAIAQNDDRIAEALFVWSALNLLYVFGVSGRLGESLCDDLDWGTRGDRILGVGFIPMILGIVTVLESYESFQTPSSTPLQNILSVGNLEEIQPPDEATDAEDEQFCQLRSIWENNNNASIYENTLQALRQCRFFMEQFSDKATKDAGDFDRTWQGAFAFVGLAPKEYFPLLHQRQPPALILYAFYGGLLYSLDDCWFMEGWGYDIVEVVNNLLGSYWESWIAWPVKAVNLK
ncbi:hypothetical protein BKA60DRAFT_491791, partial [Fusarium oxysporum]